MEQCCEALFIKSKSSAAIANICKPAVEAYQQARKIVAESKKSGNPVLIGNAEGSLKECKRAKDELDIFKKDLGSFVRFYEFMSQIVDYADKGLEKLNLFARNLSPMLRESNIDEDDIDLNNVELSHYRLTVLCQQDLKLKDKQEGLLSQIINRLNELFITDNLSDGDLVNYFHAIKDKVRKNPLVMAQIANNPPEQALLGDFNTAVDEAIIDSGDAYNNQRLQLLSNPEKAKKFARLVFDLLQA